MGKYRKTYEGHFGHTDKNTNKKPCLLVFQIQKKHNCPLLLCHHPLTLFRCHAINSSHCCNSQSPTSPALPHCVFPQVLSNRGNLDSKRESKPLHGVSVSLVLDHTRVQAQNPDPNPLPWPPPQLCHPISRFSKPTTMTFLYPS